MWFQTCGERVRECERGSRRERALSAARHVSLSQNSKIFRGAIYIRFMTRLLFFPPQLFTPLCSTNNCRSTFESSSFYIHTLFFFGIVYNNLNTHSHIASPHFACKHRVLFRKRRRRKRRMRRKKKYTIARHTAERIMSMFTDT